jgi:hypothetical protein
VDNRSEVREFLTSRRAKVTPEQSGPPVFGGNRRVTGLRREEVAMLARGEHRLLHADGYRPMDERTALKVLIRP